jgi:group I intron endonuclease
MIVYKVTNLVNGKVYIGYTTKTLDQRIKAHLRKANCLTQKHHTQAFKLALRKYGKECFLWEELVTCSTKEEACEKEKHFISEYNCVVPLGYNMTLGGEGGILSEDVKIKISNSVKDYHKNNPEVWLNSTLANASTEQRSEWGKKAANTKTQNGFKYKTGFTRPQESREKMSKTRRKKYSCTWYNFKTKTLVEASSTDMSEFTGLSVGTFNHLKHERLRITKCGWTYVPAESNYIALNEG